MVSQIVGASFANGAQFPNYVNGRVLAAEDLAAGQSTLRQRDQWAGQTAGTGVVSGLWVTGTATTLVIASGLGISPSGEPVSLQAPVTLQLMLAGPAGAVSGATFSNCATTAASQPAISSGTYLLTALPACQLQGQAPTASAPGTSMPATCTAQWQVEGVQFKAILLSSLALGASVEGVEVTSALLRNLAAYWCFGDPELSALGNDVFNFTPPWAGLSQLSSSELTPCDLPLCVFSWDNGNIDFVDNWSVRRRITRPDVSNGNWTAVEADERSAEGEARFLQFQDQVQSLVSAGVTGTTTASDVFGILPPAGFLPVTLAQIDSDVRDLVLRYETSPPTDGVQDVQDFVAVNISFQQAARTYVPVDVLEQTVVSRFEVDFTEMRTQSGFIPEVFFGGLARCGGIIPWDMAYLALRQSYFMGSVSTSAPVLADVKWAPFTYYYIAENVVTIVNTFEQTAQGFQASVTPYVVFIKSQFWPYWTLPPVITSQRVT